MPLCGLDTNDISRQLPEFEKVVANESNTEGLRAAHRVVRKEAGILAEITLGAALERRKSVIFSTSLGVSGTSASSGNGG